MKQTIVNTKTHFVEYTSSDGPISLMDPSIEIYINTASANPARVIRDSIRISRDRNIDMVRELIHDARAIVDTDEGDYALDIIDEYVAQMKAVGPESLLLTIHTGSMSHDTGGIPAKPPEKRSPRFDDPGPWFE